MTSLKGKKGEQIAQKILTKQGFRIIERNFYSRYGEIDIIAQRGEKIHFIEVKSTYGSYNPAENFHHSKFCRLMKTIDLYRYKYRIPEDLCQIDLALVNLRDRTFSLICHANLYFD